MNTVYKKQPDGTYKKVILTEKTVNGVLQFVDEKELLRGYTGITGSDGRDGIDGKSGRDGRDGIDGKNGEMGLQGPIGLQGEKGLDGYTPIKGVDYFDGEMGLQGPIGLQGEKGLDGYTPIKGIDYFDGEMGLQGPIGLRGEQGLQGEPGIKGDKGDKGDIGPRGFMGERGATGPAGATGPQGKQGIQGPKGERGSPGLGIQGPQGEMGPTGPAGSGGGAVSYSEVKNGIIVGASFSGTQKSYTVTFPTAYTYSTYAVAICGDDPRTWSVSNKLTTGFTVDSNSSVDIIGEVYWITTYGSGSIQSNNRRGIVANTAWYQSFAGLPYKTDILFADPLSASYSVVIGGEDPRTWSVDNVSLTGFTITSNSNVSITGNTFWQCIEV